LENIGYIIVSLVGRRAMGSARSESPDFVTQATCSVSVGSKRSEAYLRAKAFEVVCLCSQSLRRDEAREVSVFDTVFLDEVIQMPRDGFPHRERVGSQSIAARDVGIFD
jgi:hypothetical protein